MRIGICSGYFNPLHVGHLQMLHDARFRSDYSIVIVNNDKQQLLKKGRIIINENDRVAIVKELRCVDEVVLSIDEDRTVCRTLLLIRQRYYNDLLTFLNGGDRNSEVECPETDVCKNNRIVQLWGIGGKNKHDSSSRIIEEAYSGKTSTATKRATEE